MKTILIITILHLLTPYELIAQWANTGPNGQSLSSISFLTANLGWACGSAGSLYKTTDGGTTWQYQSNFATPGLLNRLRAVGTPYQRQVLVIWETPLNPQPTATYISTNTGMVFQAQDYGTFNNMSFRNANLAILVGDNGTTRLSTDGTVWRNPASGTQANLRDGDCPTGQDCYVVGDGGAIRRSNTATTGFLGQNSGTSIRLNGVSFASASQGCVVGHNGTVLRTINGGTTWTHITVPTTVNLYDVWLINANVGFAVGELGTILVTTDGGLTWNLEPTNMFETLYSLTATADGSNIWAAGDGGTVVKRGPVVLSAKLKAQTVSWQAFPNPFSNVLKLDIPRLAARKLEIRLCDATGRQVLHEDISSSMGQSSHALAMPAYLPPGVYHLQLSIDSQPVETRRLVKFE